MWWVVSFLHAHAYSIWWTCWKLKYTWLMVNCCFSIRNSLQKIIICIFSICRLRHGRFTVLNVQKHQMMKSHTDSWYTAKLNYTSAASSSSVNKSVHHQWISPPARRFICCMFALLRETGDERQRQGLKCSELTQISVSVSSLLLSVEEAESLILL